MRFCNLISVVNEPMGLENRDISKSLFGADVTAARIQFMSSFHSGTETGEKQDS